MAQFNIGDYVRRLDEDYCGQGLTKGDVYVVASCYDSGNKNRPKDYRVKLVGFGNRVWDAHRFEIATPFYVQVCPHGIHWQECSTHKHGKQ